MDLDDELEGFARPKIGEASARSEIARDRRAQSVRRDAIARVLCARICSERRTIAELDALDRMLTKIERVEDGLIELRRQTFWPTSQEWPGVFEVGGDS